MNEWISVKDRLPKKGSRVLANSRGFVHEAYFSDKGKWKRYGSEFYSLFFGSVTHWMPLPEPPKEEK